jgi:hypothetical protein
MRPPPLRKEPRTGEKPRGLVASPWQTLHPAGRQGKAPPAPAQATDARRPGKSSSNSRGPSHIQSLPSCPPQKQSSGFVTGFCAGETEDKEHEAHMSFKRRRQDREWGQPQRTKRTRKRGARGSRVTDAVSSIGFFPLLAHASGAEHRKRIAHGVSRGSPSPTGNQPRTGRQNPLPFVAFWLRGFASAACPGRDQK